MTETYRQTVLDIGTNQVGLEREEAEFLWELIAPRTRYATYEELLALNGELAGAALSNTVVRTIGYSRDHPETHPEPRRIELATVGTDGENAYEEGPGHAPEGLAGETASVHLRLFDKYPEIIYRMGYDSVSLCSTFDPDGQKLQSWGNRPNSLLRFVLGGYRGSGREQPAWDYPTPDWSQSGPEALASWTILQELDPIFYGSLHASKLTAFHVASHCGTEAMGNELTRTLEAFHLPVNYSEPESPNTPILARGVFQRAGKSTIQQVATEKIEGGTSAIDHISPHTLMLISEIPWMTSKIAPGDPETPYTRLDAFRHRTQQANEIIAHIGSNLTLLDGWIQRNIGDPDVRRLFNAASWWHKEVPDVLNGELAYVEENPSDHQKLRQSEYMQLTSPTIINSLLYLGNVYQLACRAHADDVARSIRRVVRHYLHSVEPVRYIPVNRQLGAQALCMLIGMRHAAKPKGAAAHGGTTPTARDVLVGGAA